MPEARVRFPPGTRVVVAEREWRGHTRTPRYIRGRAGVVERVCGAFENPERLALGFRGEPAVTLYRVRFLQRNVWSDYAGAASDTLDVEIFEHWLARVT